ncbi:MAG: lactonase family protein [Muribaculaceae bacterium]|nr:lactonase family protein [Muribaculaceae bacterium]
MKKYLLGGLAVLLMSCSAKTEKETESGDLRMIVGCYTDTGSQGLYSFVFDEENGTFNVLDSCRIDNPSYLTVSEDKEFIYSVSELNSSASSAVALKFDHASGLFKILNSQKTEGTDPCYISTNGKIVVTANYGGSMSVFPIEEDGKLGAMSQFFEGSTGGPDSTRQDTPHIHCAEFSVDGNNLYASDFSADRLLLYKVEEGTKIIPMVTDADHQIAIELQPDNGPRHIVFDKSGKFAYVIGELSGLVTVLEKEPSGNEMVVKQEIDADPFVARGSADIHLSPDGKFLYASNRLNNDGIAIFKVDEKTGMLTKVGYQLTGKHPRNFAISPNGKYLLCACRDTDEIEIYEINQETGLLTSCNTSIKLKKPVCIKFC